VKVCIPSSDAGGLDARSGAHYGRAPWFHVVETDDDSCVSVQNPACHTREGGCHHTSMLKRLGVDAIAGVMIGRGAHASLTEAGIDVLQVEGLTVRDVRTAVREGRARPMDFGSACEGQHHQHRHGHGHGHCHA